MTAVFTPCKEGVLVSVRVTARAQRDEVTGVRRASDGSAALSVRVRAVREQGKANKAVTETVAKALGVAKSTVRIKSGETSRNKILLVCGEPDEIVAIMTPQLEKWRKETE